MIKVRPKIISSRCRNRIGGGHFLHNFSHLAGFGIGMDTLARETQVNMFFTRNPRDITRTEPLSGCGGFMASTTCDGRPFALVKKRTSHNILTLYTLRALNNKASGSYGGLGSGNKTLLKLITSEIITLRHLVPSKYATEGKADGLNLLGTLVKSIKSVPAHTKSKSKQAM